MTTYGLLSTGFNPKTLAIVKSELEDDFRGVFGASIDLNASGPFGQIIGVVAERLAEVWDAAQEVYAGFDPDQATGSALDALCALTGTLRNAATHSTVTVTCSGTAGTTIPAGTQFSVVTTGVKFETLAAGTMPGTFGYVDIDCQSVDTGPLVALAGTLTTIETPVDGLTSVTNALDADMGSDEETDAALRLRREEEIRTTETGSLEAIREAVLAVTGVDQCVVFENVTMVTDSDSIPPKAVNVVVDAGTATNAAIAAAIFGSVAAGIETYGTSHSITVTDTQGTTHAIEFDDATLVPCYVTATITYDADHWPTDGTTQAQTAILLYESDNLVMGKDLIARAVGAYVFRDVEGVVDCAVTVGIAPSPSGSSVTVTLRQLATLDSSRIVINSSAVTP
jgi:uncharacterized phage protein gp47/JayE